MQTSQLKQDIECIFIHSFIPVFFLSTECHITVCLVDVCSSGTGDDYNLHKKKHKKHKKHKKKHHRDDGHSFSSEALESLSDSGMLVLKPPQLKLKIKLGGQTLGTKRSVLSPTMIQTETSKHELFVLIPLGNGPKL